MKSIDLINKAENNNRILCIGEVLWDMLPTGAKAGGAPMNVALHLKNFGLEAMFAGRIGNDQLGRDLKSFLKRKHLDTTLIQIDPELPTSTAVVHLGEDHQVRFEIVDQVAWDRFEMTHELQLAADAASVIIYGTLASRHTFTRKTILSMLDKQCLKLIDVNLRPPFNIREVVEKLLSRADIAKLNDEELKAIGGWHSKNFVGKELTEWFAEKFHFEIVCVTRGANGALIYNHGTIFEHPGYKVRVADTVGAGDAFLAGFLAMYLSNEPLDKALDFACATGAFVASKEGATPNYRLEDIMKITNN